MDIESSIGTDFCYYHCIPPFNEHKITVDSVASFVQDHFRISREQVAVEDVIGEGKVKLLLCL